MRRSIARLLTFLRFGRADDDLAREIEAHLALLQDHYEATGMVRDDARRAARLSLGGVEQTKERHRAARSFVRLENLLRDVRWAWRGVHGRGWRAALVIGLLATAIAANTAVFTVADALVFNPYPYDHPERIVTLKETLPEGTRLTKPVAAARLLEWRKQAGVFSAVGGYLQKNVFLMGSGLADQVRTADVTVGFLDVLAVKPRWGRAFVDGDESRSEFAVLISAPLARKYFGDAARAVGQVLDATAGPHRVVGVSLVWLGSTALLGLLPETLRLNGQHRIGIDARTIGYTTLVAAGTWVFAALPPVIAASRPSLLALLRLEDRGAAMSRAGVGLRHALTVAQVAVAVTLVIGGLLYTRSYRELLALDKGFDSTGLAELSWIVPSGHFHSGAERAEAMSRLITTLRKAPGIEAITESAPPPGIGDSPSSRSIEIDDQPPLVKPVEIGAKWVDAAYFSVVRLPLRAGRVFVADDVSTDVVVTDTFAKRFWPGGAAVGHSFRLRPQQPWNRVIGVVGDFRSDRAKLPSVSDGEFRYYRLPDRPVVAPARPAISTPTLIDDGGPLGYFSLTVRMTSARNAPAVLATAQSFDPQLRATLDMVDDMYADKNADTRLASQVVGGFSLLTLLVAMAGVYGLMAFLVSSRRREIGVRIALGASPGNISRLILGSSARLVAAGVVLGVAAAVIASRWIESALFGIAATDPATYIVVVAAVVVTALAATWQPARQAAQTDPASMLRAD